MGTPTAEQDPDTLAISTIRGLHAVQKANSAYPGMRSFGASAPLEQLLTKFGFTPDPVAAAARECLSAAGAAAG